MAVTNENVELRFDNIVAGVTIDVAIKLFAEADIVVYYGSTRIEAVQGTDYTVTLTPDDYLTFSITPTVFLLDKITAAGTGNFIAVRRILANTSDFVATDAFLREKITTEFDKTLMRIQEMQPPRAMRAGRVLEYDAYGNAIPGFSAIEFRDEAAIVKAKATEATNAATAAGDSAAAAAVSEANAAQIVGFDGTAATVVVTPVVEGAGNAQAALAALSTKTTNTNTNVAALDADLTAVEGKVLPAGGAAGQLLRKTSATDYATEWVAPRYGPNLSEPLNASYWTARVARVQRVPELAMTGHFHLGSWAKPFGRVFPTPAPSGLNYALLDIGVPGTSAGMLAYEGWASQNVWYNWFAVANDADAACAYKATPSLRVGSVSGSVATLNACGENSYPSPAVAKSFQFATNVLAGVKVLVVTETVGSWTNSWSGRIATITANTATTLTLDVIGGVNVGDYLIPLPSEDNYVWLCDLYYENNGGSDVAIRNIGGVGAFERGAYMANLTWNFPAAGAAISRPGNRMDYAGSASPLARSAIVQSYFTGSSGATGGYAVYIDQDGASHDIDTHYDEKRDTTAAQTFNKTLRVAGSYGPWFFFSNAGSPAMIQSHSLLVMGWKY